VIDRRDAHVIKGGKRAGYRMTAANTHARVRTLIAVVALATTAGTLALAAGSAAAAAAVSTPRPAHTVSQIDKPAATPPSDTIAGATQLTLGDEQSGGGGPVDFWRVKLTGGDQVQIATQTPTMTPGGAYTSYSFELYPPGTTDTSFPQTPPVFTTATPGGGSAKAIITLKAPYTGTFILAVCEDATGDCRSTDNGSGINPMQPYTFTPAITGGPATMTSLKLSASRVQYGDEKALKLTVTVKARYSSAHPAGTVTIKAGKKRICTVKLARGKGTCSPASRKLLAVGTYHLVASYDGSKTFSASASKAATLKIARAKRK